MARRFPQIAGAFAVQSNNDTRVVEYPWAFHAAEVRPGSSVLEIGGGLAGFQFVLARCGAQVTNVDPGLEAAGVGFFCTQDEIARLNTAFKTDVRLLSSTLHAAGVPSESVDTIYSISTIEHIPQAELPALASEMRRVLKPGGQIILTIDLFLDLEPFTARASNRFGTNIDVQQLVVDLDCELVLGNTSELNGFPDFSAESVLAALPTLYYGVGYPACAQMLTLRKPA